MFLLSVYMDVSKGSNLYISAVYKTNRQTFFVHKGKEKVLIMVRLGRLEQFSL